MGGKNLYDEVEKALNNKKIITFLRNKNKENHGIVLGLMQDPETAGEIVYGITLNELDKSRAKLFTYEHYRKSNDFKFKTGYFFPFLPNFQGSHPTTGQFKEEVRIALEEPQSLDLTNYKVS